jgi:hypothetical protein
VEESQNLILDRNPHLCGGTEENKKPSILGVPVGNEAAVRSQKQYHLDPFAWCVTILYVRVRNAQNKVPPFRLPSLKMYNLFHQHIQNTKLIISTSRIAGIRHN